MKKTIMILLVLAMMLTVFAVACGNDAKPAAEDSRTLDDNDDVEAARGSANSGGYDFDGITLEDWQRVGAPDDEASFRGSAFDTSNLESMNER